MKGIYVLLISVSEDARVRVGALGRRLFRRGLYVYVGSAQNSLESRVERHLRKGKRRFWHVDYLLGNRGVEVQSVFWKEAGRLEECRVAERLLQVGIPVSGFGSSDCRCRSHLFRIGAGEGLNEFVGEMELERFKRDGLDVK